MRAQDMPKNSMRDYKSTVTNVTWQDISLIKSDTISLKKANNPTPTQIVYKKIRVARHIILGLPDT